MTLLTYCLVVLLSSSRPHSVLRPDTFLILIDLLSCWSRRQGDKETIILSPKSGPLDFHRFHGSDDWSWKNCNSRDGQTGGKRIRSRLDSMLFLNVFQVYLSQIYHKMNAGKPVKLSGSGYSGSNLLIHNHKAKPIYTQINRCKFPILQGKMLILEA